jgi:hypothetical protein
MQQILGHRRLYRDPRLGFSPCLSPRGSGRDILDPLGRLGHGASFDIVRGGALGRAAWGPGIFGGGALGVRGGELLPGALVGNRGAWDSGLRGDPIRQAFRRELYRRGIDPCLGRFSVNELDLRLLPYDRFRGGGWPHGSDCDTCWRERLYHEHQGHPGNGCSCRRSCGESSNSNSKSNFNFKTKDITIRGKARAVRASYLTEATKFESELTKYMEKKTEDEVPERVVDMLISFINREEYSNSDVLDEVILNILASNVGAKSTVDYSLSRIKDCGFPPNGRLICGVITLITQSGKVDDGLKKWLEKELKAKECELYWALIDDEHFHKLWSERPEVVVEVQRMVGERDFATDGVNPL